MHTHNSLTSSIKDTILKDDWKTLLKIKDKLVMIIGTNDWYVDNKLATNFTNYQIKKMEHIFFNHEKEIAKIMIKESSR